MSVCVCTPTANRRWSQAFSEFCMKEQTIQPVKWIVLDNSDPEKGWVPSPRFELHHVEGKKTVGWMRNRCLELALKTSCDYIVFWDDDDYYPPERIYTGIRGLVDSGADIAGSSQLFLLLTKENVLLTIASHGDHHATAATYTIRRAYAETHRFDESKKYSEEYLFTNSWTAKMVQVAPEHTIVVMGHSTNTVDKSMLLDDMRTFRAEITNDANGKQVFRSKWSLSPELWGLWRTTFSV